MTADGDGRARDPRLRGAGTRSIRPASETVEHVARTLLRRYGVVSWRLLEREAAWLPPWRELLRVFHRLEARGEIRGGRFVAGLSGEQFALPEAIGALRAVRNRGHDGALVNLSASDPLTLVGAVLPGFKVPRLPGARVLYRDGLPLATLVAGSIELLAPLVAADEQLVRTALLRERGSWDAPMPVPASIAGATAALSRADHP